MKKNNHPHIYNNISIIFQGPIPEYESKNWKLFRSNLSFLKRKLPNSEIIISTWKDSNLSGLLFDKLVLNDDPKNFKVTSIWNDQVIDLNLNRQIISSLNGLSKASKEFSVKLRTDNGLINFNFINFLLKSMNFKTGRHSVFESLVISLPPLNPLKPLFGGKNLLYRTNLNVPDWFFAGKTKDLYKLWDIPMVKESNYCGEKVLNHFKITNYYSPEQYLIYNLIKKDGLDLQILSSYKPFNSSLIEESEKFLVSNFYFIPANMLGLVSYKYPNSSYCAIPVLSQGLYTFNDWKYKFNKFNNNGFYVKNIFEDFLYLLIYKTRVFLFFNFKTLYYFLIKIKRKVYDKFI